MTPEEKNAAISRRILDRVEAGDTLETAIDAVLGSGQYAAIVDDVYRTIVARSVVAQVCKNMGVDATVDIDGFDSMTVDQLSDELAYLADYQG
jgi:hypothetical protein